MAFPVSGAAAALAALFKIRSPVAIAGKFAVALMSIGILKIVCKIIALAGIFLFVMKGSDILLDGIETAIYTNFDGLPVNMANIIFISNIDRGVTIVLSAYIATASVRLAQGFSKPIVGGIG